VHRVGRHADFAYIAGLFATFGPVAVRRMFGGAGIYSDDVMFALVSDGVIYLKADEHTRPSFAAEGLGPFTYGKAEKRVVMSYWRMPDRLYDDPEELARWAAEALAVARRRQAIPRDRRKRRRVVSRKG
jgi:DNA transformation protein